MLDHIHGGVASLVRNLFHCPELECNLTFQDGSNETITDIITKGLFIDIENYIQGLHLFEEVKVKSIREAVHA